MLAAQIDNALGIRHLMMHDPKTGKFQPVMTLRYLCFWKCVSNNVLHAYALEASFAQTSALSLRLSRLG